ncbi:MAG: PHP domain-containing protein [Nitrospinae bacterium]|nr:PHP domain-containing protein [Nitrospinota bacterium]
MLMDVHLHTTKYSWCSNIDPQEAVKRALELKLDGIVLVEHDVVWKPEEILRLKEETGAGDLVILRGIEISCNTKEGLRHGHLLSFGFYQAANHYYRLCTEEVIAEVHRAGGVAIAAHPFRGGFGFGDDIYRLDLDAIEVYHPQHDPPKIRRAEQACQELNLPSTGGSDAHELKEIGLHLTYFSNPIATEKELVKEIKAKRCRPASPSELRGP